MRISIIHGHWGKMISSFSWGLHSRLVYSTSGLTWFSCVLLLMFQAQYEVIEKSKAICNLQVEAVEKPG